MKKMPSNVKPGKGNNLKVKCKKKIRSSRENSHDGSDLELDRELYPIGHFISDRAEMVEQMFGVLTKDKIQSMLPPVLKEIDWKDLKTQCLEQLNSMSEKQIFHVLEGKPYAPDLEKDDSEKNPNINVVSRSSSSSSSSSSSCGESSLDSKSCDESKDKLKPDSKGMSKNQVTVKPDPDRLEDDPDMLEIGLSHNEMGDLLEEEEDLEKKHKALKKKDKAIEQVDKKGKDERKSGNVLDKKSEPKEGKTLLEILELEMRARAIRALLKQASAPGKSSAVKPDTSDTKKKSCNKGEKSSSEQPPNQKNSRSLPLKEKEVVIKEEVLSDEDDVVFVGEAPSDSSPPKEVKNQVQKECLSAVYNVAADILKFKPTVMSSTSKVSVVDTSGNPIILPKVKAQSKVRTVDSNIIVIDGDLPDSPSSVKNLPNIQSKEQEFLKKKANCPDYSSMGQSDASSSTDPAPALAESEGISQAKGSVNLSGSHLGDCRNSKEIIVEISKDNGKKVIVSKSPDNLEN